VRTDIGQADFWQRDEEIEKFVPNQVRKRLGYLTVVGLVNGGNTSTSIIVSLEIDLKFVNEDIDMIVSSVSN
jgi:hypothetical protein